MFILWVRRSSDFALFRKLTIEIPSSIGAARLLKSGTALLRNQLLFTSASFTVALVGVVCLLAGIFLLLFAVLNLNSKSQTLRSIRVASYLVVALLSYQNLFTLSAGQDPENAAPFIGLVLAATAASLSAIFERMDLRLSLPDGGLQRYLPGMPVLYVFVAILALAAGYQGWTTDRKRVVQQFDRNKVRFTERVAIPRLDILWGEPTEVGDQVVQRSDVEGLWRFLNDRARPFFVAGDATMFYGLTGQPSPQPLLYFQGHHSYRPEDISWLDPLITGSLRRRHVDLFIKETAIFVGAKQFYEQFPELSSWMADFHHTRSFGIYEIWEK
jgi:hypothetical protein